MPKRTDLSAGALNGSDHLKGELDGRSRAQGGDAASGSCCGMP
jgi:hypothetical protein